VTDGSPNTLRKIFRSWPLDEVRRFFEVDLGLPLKLEPESGKLFPVAGKARAVLDALLTHAERAGVALHTGARVVGLVPGANWAVRLATDETLDARRVILATGGLSVPTTGSDGAGLRVVQELGHTLVRPYPALVPLTGENPAHHALAGLSTPVSLTAPLSDGKRSFQTQGGFLFTHRGYSGPAVLNMAHIAVRSTLLPGPRPPIWVKWTPLAEADWHARLQNAHGSLVAILREYLPERLAVQLLDEAGVAGIEGSQLGREARRRLVETLTHYRLPWHGHEGYRTAEVTGGGVPLSEVDSATLESKLLPRLHLCGEILDAFGPIGGYNFLWAWITGRMAGLATASPGA